MLKKLNLLTGKENNLRLSDFEIIKLDRKKGALGVGSFATVQLASHKQSQKYFALKTVKPPKISIKLLDRFYWESLGC
jgi:hypothetical protein